MRWKGINKHFDIDIPQDEPVYPVNVVCGLLHMQYYLLHEIIKEGIIRERKKQKQKKLFSKEDIKVLRYVQYLIEEKGINVRGVKIILEMQED